MPLLRCPEDGGKFARKDGHLVCATCARQVPLVDGRIPNFIRKSEEEKIGCDSHSYLMLRERSAFWRWVSDHVPRPHSVLIRRRDDAMISQFVHSIPEEKLVLNVGSGNKDYGPRVINMDIFPGENVDLMAVSAELPLADACVGGALSLATLEHVFAFNETLREMDRVLAPGGATFHVIPFMQPAHGVPRDYRRFTVNGIEDLFPGYARVRCGVIAGPGSAICWSLREYFAILTSCGNKFLYTAGRYGWGWVFWPLKFTDYFLTGSRFAAQLASACYYWAKKPG